MKLADLTTHALAILFAWMEQGVVVHRLMNREDFSVYVSIGVLIYSHIYMYAYNLYMILLLFVNSGLATYLKFSLLVATILELQSSMYNFIVDVKRLP